MNFKKGKKRQRSDKKLQTKFVFFHIIITEILIIIIKTKMAPTEAKLHPKVFLS